MVFARVIAIKIAWAAMTLLVMSIITFAATSSSPVDVARNALGREVTNEQLERFIADRGLNRPVVVRYAAWLGDFVRGDFGTSTVTGRNVRDDVMPRLGNTLVLAALTLAISLPVSLGLAVYMALHVGRWQDLMLLSSTTVLTALPEFVTGMALILVFGVALHWLPIDSTALSFQSGWSAWASYVLPVLSMLLVSAPYTIRIARSAIRESLSAPHTRTAVLAGLSRRRVVALYVVLPAAVPIINTLALNLVYLISGVVVIENVFAFPGIGRRLVEAITTSDIETVQAIAIVMGAMFIAITQIADMAAAIVNPRLRSK